MSKLYRPSHRGLQARYDTARLADRIEATLFREQFTAEDRAFIERLDMFFLATADAEGRPSCSFKGGDPGFVRVSGESELVFPCYDGNGMFLSMGNAAENPNVGLLFIDFESPKRLRVNGTAQLVPPESVSPPYFEAQFIVRVTVRQIFPNCPRYVPKLSAWNLPGSCRAPVRSLPYRGGSAWIGRRTCSPKAIPVAIRTERKGADSFATVPG